MTTPIPRRTLVTALVAATALATLGHAGTALAQSWPSKPIKLIVPYAAGGATDITARAIGEKLSARLGQPVLVDNRGGAGGVTGTDAALKSPADGHTLLLSLGTTMLINQYLYEKLPYNPQKDQALITQIALAPVVLLVNPQLQVSNAPELLAYIEKNKNKVAYGSWGMGSYSHLAGAWLSDKLKADMNHVPYKGEAPMLQDLVGGQFQMAFASLQSARPYIDSGKLKALAVTGGQRMDALPKVSTMAEQGIKDEVFQVTGWLGMSAPAKTPPEVVARLGTEVQAILALPDVRDRILQMGFIPVGSSPEQFNAQFKKDAPVWERVVKVSGATLE
ncbi:tripartite tricarboxylate transporter substrate binding protein [Rhodoferax sp. TBRC 17198]|mgnify:CR=1 FL=1|uniref:Bug family tripartite tricarboxylate transporter substrate binding protein n=1 Tax=Rhodoferax potami TaxID=3068338 RepID=UPI0028BE02FB|nr:tripartite tricarboxylate transporter substrate binding protein [Rhodoferax sp. TBRC 17198]MDT7522251.1 tripartite tricarboxylate transporter substrate binding protein [Rhodoferax sp. TBRC 17198]